MLTILAFVVGLAVGSFLNVVADELARQSARQAQGKTLAKALGRTRSVCNHCKRTLRWYELVPVVSFVVLRGRCANCRQPIPWRYPLVELATGLVAAGVVFTLPGKWLEIIITFALSSVFLVLAAVDQQTEEVPETGLWLALGLAVLVVMTRNLPAPAGPTIPELETTFYGLIFAAAAIAPFVFVARGALMGQADLLLAITLGLWLGFPAIVVAIMLSFVLGGAVGLLLIITGRKKRTDTVGFVPFLVAGGMLAYFFGEKIINHYLRIV